MATKPTKRKPAAAKKTPTRKATPKAAAKKAVAKRTAPKTASARPAPAKKAATGKGGPKRPTKKPAPRKAAAGKPSSKTATASSTTAVKPRRGSVEKRFQPFGELLVKKQAELMQAYAIAKTDTRDRLDDGTEDYIDYAVNSYAKDFMLSLTELERQQLQLVRDAIHRLNRGEYGDCLQCGVEIPTKRLEVAPWVRYCIQCQELEDQGLLPELPIAVLDEDEAELEDVVEEEEEEDEEEVDDVPDDEDVLVTDVDTDDSEE